MEEQVRALFRRYQEFFMQSLAGRFDRDAVKALYASEFIDASPAGVTAGKNDEALLAAMAQGYEHYRKIGTKEMTVRGIRISPVDDLHCVAHVAWTAVYQRDDLPRTAIDFDVHYLVQVRDGEAKVFGWMAGDENALLKERGVI